MSIIISLLLIFVGGVLGWNLCLIIILVRFNKIIDKTPVNGSHEIFEARMDLIKQFGDML